MSDSAIIGFSLLAFVVCLILFGVASANKRHEEATQSCAALGGHLIEKSLHRSTLRLCISADGRILE